MKDFDMKPYLSRKFIVALIAAGVAFGNAMFNWGLDTAEVVAIITPLLAYIGVEGVADIKERGK